MRAGDEEAFTAFFEDNFESLYRFAWARLGQDTELAREIAQSTICKALEKLDTYRGEARLFSWLCSVCRFEITAHFRRESRRPKEVPMAGEMIATSHNGAEQQMLRDEVAGQVRVTVENLPQDYRRALTWKYEAGLSVVEIADLLGLSPKAAESLLSRARRAFRQGFSHVGENFAGSRGGEK